MSFKSITKILGALSILFILIACREKQKSVQYYDARMVKFMKQKFTASNGEFSISLPKNWQVKEENNDTDRLLYTLETHSPYSGIVIMSIMKMNIIHGSIDTEFDKICNEAIKKSSNIQLINNSTIEIDNVVAKTKHLKYENDGKVAQEEIDVFIPINDNQYYFIGLISDKDEKIDLNFGMMLDCVQSFKLIK